LRRGDIVVAVAAGDYGKPRPFLVVQCNALNDTHASILACPITSDVTGTDVRVELSGGVDTGLRSASDIMVDKLQAVRRDRFRQQTGRAPDAAMAEVDRVLPVLLQL